MVNDVISDFIARIKNAMLRRHSSVSVISNGTVVAMCEILKENGYINDFKIIEAENGFNSVDVILNYDDEDGKVISNFKRISKPGRRIYKKYRDLKPVLNGIGISIISSPKGVITDKLARKQKTGGEVLCEVY